MAQGAFGFTEVNANATTTVKSGQGILHSIVVNNPGSAWQLQLYDSVTGSGKSAGLINPVATAASPYLYDFVFVNGLTIVSTGTTPGSVTVTFC